MLKTPDQTEREKERERDILSETRTFSHLKIEHIKNIRTGWLSLSAEQAHLESLAKVF